MAVMQVPRLVKPVSLPQVQVFEVPCVRVSGRPLQIAKLSSVAAERQLLGVALNVTASLRMVYSANHIGAGLDILALVVGHMSASEPKKYRGRLRDVCFVLGLLLPG